MLIEIKKKKNELQFWLSILKLLQPVLFCLSQKQLKRDNVEVLVLWLANTCRFLHNLKQYSGEETFQSKNNPKQSQHCLKNFDLSEYRKITSDLAVWIYQGLLKVMKFNIHPLIGKI